MFIFNKVGKNKMLRARYVSSARMPALLALVVFQLQCVQQLVTCAVAAGASASASGLTEVGAAAGAPHNSNSNKHGKAVREGARRGVY